MIKLKPCPFCGAEPVAEFERKDIVQIRCPECGTRKGVKIYAIGNLGRCSLEKFDMAYEAAARQWNQRPAEEDQG